MRLFLASALLLACRTPAPSASSPMPEAPMQDAAFQPTLVLDPMEAQVAPGGAVTFHAATNYPEGIRYMRQPVKWEVVEPEGGAITMHGLYTAPASAGTFHVRVTRTDAEGRGLYRTATVTVR
ncbi:MAG TPA: hypothetical protein VJ600_06845 [Holophagaceae bacterium]|nr:hypothetical protein [Holophagaceae bacterium]